jgi:hypothetical protein
MKNKTKNGRPNTRKLIMNFNNQQKCSSIASDIHHETCPESDVLYHVIWSGCQKCNTESHTENHEGRSFSFTFSVDLFPKDT